MGNKFATSEVLQSIQRAFNMGNTDTMWNACLSGLLYDEKKKLYYSTTDAELHTKFTSGDKPGKVKDVSHKYDISTVDKINDMKMFKNNRKGQITVDETIFEKLKKFRKKQESPEGMGEKLHS